MCLKLTARPQFIHFATIVIIPFCADRHFNWTARTGSHSFSLCWNTLQFKGRVQCQFVHSEAVRRKIKPIWLWRGFWVCLQRSFTEVKHAAVTTAPQRSNGKKQKKTNKQKSISKDASIISLKRLSAPLQGIEYKQPRSKQTLTLPITLDDDETVYRQFPDVHCCCWRLQAYWVGLPVPISRTTPPPQSPHSLQHSSSELQCQIEICDATNWNDAGANPSRFMSHLISYFSILSSLLLNEKSA